MSQKTAFHLVSINIKIKKIKIYFFYLQSNTKNNKFLAYEYTACKCKSCIVLDKYISWTENISPWNLAHINAELKENCHRIKRKKIESQ